MSTGLTNDSVAAPDDPQRRHSAWERMEAWARARVDSYLANARERRLAARAQSEETRQWLREAA